MAKRESVQKKLQRIRPPRVQLTYDVEVSDGKEIKELPFVVGILGDFSAASQLEKAKLKDIQNKEKEISFYFYYRFSFTVTCIFCIWWNLLFFYFIFNWFWFGIFSLWSLLLIIIIIIIVIC